MRTLIFMTLLMILGSCSPRLTPFSQRLYDDFNWSNQEVSRIQFYLSDDIVLWRERGSEASKIQNGKIRIRDGQEVEEVVFKKGTPGIMVFSPKENRFAVSFEDSDDKYLMFGPNPNVDNRYVLLGREWNKRSGKVTYDNKIYNTSASNAFTTLMVDLKAARDYNKSTSVAEGRRVD